MAAEEKGAAPASAKPELVRKMGDSTARQAASVQKQAGAPPKGGFFTTAWTSPDPQPIATNAPADCEPLAEKEIEPLIASAATAWKVKPELLRAVIRVESAYRACAVSDKGAMGLMQIMPATAADFSLGDAFDPKQNINAGAKYLKQLLDRYQGDLKLALAAYNAGPGRVTGGSPPDFPETATYVDRILAMVTPQASPDAGNGPTR